MEVDYLGVDPNAKDFWQVRRFNLGKIYLMNKRAGRNDESLAEELARVFNVCEKTVYRSAKFALKCRHRGMIPGTPVKVKYFSVVIDEEAVAQKKVKARKVQSMNAKSRKNERKSEAIAYKGGQCSYCGIKYDGENAAIFDFHHRDPKTKELNIGQALETTWEVLKAELDKTDMVCSNCHRLIHHRGK